MRAYVNGKYIDLEIAPEKIATIQAEAEQAEREYWQSAPTQKR